MARSKPSARFARLAPWASTAGCVGLVMLLAIAPSTALAQEEPEAELSRRGAYVGGSIAGMVPLFDADTPGLNSEQDGSFGWNFRVGYRAMRLLAVEFQYEEVDGFSTSGALQDGVAKARILTANMRLIAPLPDFPGHPYLLAGLGAGQYWVNNEIGGISPLRGKQWELAGRFGAGLDYYVTPHIVVNLETTAIVSENKIFIERVPFVSISGGLQYRF